MNILIVTDAYPPEIRSISFMVQELAEEFSLRGHRVTVATCWPKYNLSEREKKQTFKELSIENNVEVIRIKTLPHHKVNFIIRGIGELSLPYLFLRKIKRIVKQKIDVVIVYSSPLPLAAIGISLKKQFGAKFILNIQDIFPQNAIDLGIMKNKLIINFFEKIELNAYRNADKMTSHTETSTNFLIRRKNVHPKKIATVPNWIDVNAYKNIEEKGEFRKRYNLKNKFIILFAGIIGPAQNLDFIIQIAQEIPDLPDICFLFVGDGSEKRRLQNMVKEKGIPNVKFQPFISKEEYPYLVKDADVGLLCLSSKNKTPVVPGKIYGFMAASIPVVAFLNRESDGHDLIKKSKCGASMIASDYKKATELIKRFFLERDKFTQYGKNGHEYVIKHFSKKECIDKLESLIRN